VIKVAIIEDQRGVREGLCELIERNGEFRCVAAWPSAEEALSRIGNGSELPDVALVDIGLPGMSGIEAVRIIKQRHPGIMLVMLTVFEDDQRIFEALCAGASGYLLKRTPAPRLLDGIRDAAAGGAPISPGVASRVITLFRQVQPFSRITSRRCSVMPWLFSRPAPDDDHNLTPHELRLLKLLVAGHNYKSAATELGVSFNTISFHMKRIYHKLHVHSKSEAVAKVLRKHIIG